MQAMQAAFEEMDLDGSGWVSGQVPLAQHFWPAFTWCLYACLMAACGALRSTDHSDICPEGTGL